MDTVTRSKPAQLVARHMLAASAFWLCGAAFAGEVAAIYPSRPVRLVVPFVPGGLPDTIARVVAQRLSDNLGQSFLVDNRPGAGGAIAGQFVAKSPADGYALLVADVQLWAISPVISHNLPYQPLRDLVPVSILGRGSNFLVVSTALPISNFRELVTLVKANPAKYNYGSVGVGTIHHLTMEMLKAQLGLDMVHVPYKGGSQAVPALVAGEVTVLVQALPNVSGYLKQGKVKLLAIARARRSEQAPDVPTFQELGVEGMDFPGDIGIMAPAGTPADIVNKLVAELSKAVHHPDTVGRFSALGIEPVGSSPDVYRALIQSDIEKVGKAARLSGLKAE